MLEPNISEQISALIKELVNKMGSECAVSIEDSVNGTTFNISSPDSNLLIGQRGANLYALQLLVQNLSQKRFQLMERFVIDVDDYRKKREWYLRETAKRAVEQIKRTGRPLSLEPMPPYERRVIHAYLSQENAVDTESVGSEPNRKIVIRPKQRGEI